MKPFLLFILCLLAFSGYGQTAGPINIIDNSSGSAGATHINTADLDNDGLSEIILSQGYNIDNVNIYWNNSSGNFIPLSLGSVMDPVFTATADFNGNGFLDIAVITESSGELFYYPNSGGSSGNPVSVDSESTFGKSIATGDFDLDGDEDMVAIWQHSINFYRNDGNANFTKEAILTTSSSPNILECWAMASADMDNDGDLDIVTAETLGGVIYENDGNANFSPITFTGSTNITMTNLSILDADNDSFPDVALHASSGKMKLYLNLSQLDFSYHSDLFTATQNSIRSISSVDADLDGDMDIYTAFNGDPRIFFNDGNLGFAQELILDADPNLFVEEVFSANIVGNNHPEFIWGVAAGTLAYQQLEGLGLAENESVEIKFFPNPVKDKLNLVSSSTEKAMMRLYDVSGKRLLAKQIRFPFVLDMSDFASGMYFLEINTGNAQQIKSIIKQ